MPVYLSPGVYVEEVSSGSAPIAALGTSTAGFIGVIPDQIVIPIAPVMQVTETITITTDKKESELKYFPVNTGTTPEVILIDKTTNHETPWKKFKLSPIQGPDEKVTLVLNGAIPQNTSSAKITYIVKSVLEKNEALGTLEKDKDLSNNNTLEFTLNKYPISSLSEKNSVKILGIEIKNLENSNSIVHFLNDDDLQVSKITIDSDVLRDKIIGLDPGKTKYIDNHNKVRLPIKISADYQLKFPPFKPVTAGDVQLCTSFSEFKKYFGDFSTNQHQKQLALTVYGFFNNGGTRCYVSRVTDSINIPSVLEKFEAIDEIAIVAAPGICDDSTRSAIVTHCQNMGDRFAVLDCKSGKTPSNINDKKPANSDYAAFYFPWIKVVDPTCRILNPNAKDDDLLISLPPSGHIAGVYARVDAQRGVHKAPANEVILGALGLEQKISKNHQDGLNPQGINCIRELNGNIRIWGARTIGGDDNGEFKYINVRRLFLSLRDSIDKGTQWTVFEPNDAQLWAKIRRNVNAYLMNVWRSGALFGSTPQEAFFVKCDAENNPPEVRDLGQVVIEIGVAPVKPAEFVIFRLSQWTGSSS